MSSDGVVSTRHSSSFLEEVVLPQKSKEVFCTMSGLWHRIWKYDDGLSTVDIERVFGVLASADNESIRSVGTNAKSLCGPSGSLFEVPKMSAPGGAVQHLELWPQHLQ